MANADEHGTRDQLSARRPRRVPRSARGSRRFHRRAVTIASILSVLAGLITVTANPLTAKAALGDINAFAGTGTWGFSGDGGPATAAEVNNPNGVAEDAAGNVYIADTQNHRIRKVDPSGTISTYAGTGTAGFSGDGGPAAAAELNGPAWLGIDSAGNLLVDDENNNRIRAITPSGTITTVAGNGTAGFSGDGGAATNAEINGAQTVTGLAGGGFLIGDSANNRVRKVDSSGNITTIAGNGTGGFAGDGGAATSAELNQPEAAIMDASGDLLIADCSNQRIRKVDSSGNISTIAGTGTSGFSGDGGPAANAQFNCPVGLVLSAGSLFVSDYGNGAIRKISNSGAGTITTIAGQGIGGINNTFNRVVQPWIDNSGRLFFADWWDGRVWVQSIADLLSLSNVAPSSVALGQTFAYTLTVANPGGAGTATGVTLSDPLPTNVTYVSATSSAGTCSQSSGTVTCALGTLNPGDVVTATISVTAPNATVQLSNTATVAANETDPAPADNTATALTGVNATDLALTATGSPSQVLVGQPLTYTLGVQNLSSNVTAGGVSLADTLPAGATFQTYTASQGSCTPSGGTVTCAVGSVAPSATATVGITVAAPPTAQTMTDQATVTGINPDPNPGNNSASVQTTVVGPGSILPFNVCCGFRPQGVAEDTAGNVYVAYSSTNQVIKVDTSGNSSVYAGTGGAGSSGDGGPATAAQLNQPYYLSFDAAGDLLIADWGNNEIRAVNSAGTISTVAGNGSAGYSGDGGAATSAQLSGPQAVTGLAGGGFLISETGNNVVRKVDASGKISTIAGTGSAGYSGDGGQATSAQLNEPEGTAVDPAGNILIGDCSNNVVRKIDTTGKITTIAGTGSKGFSGDGGPATQAQFNCAYGIASWGGSIYVSDYGNGAVRKIDPTGTISTVWGQGVGGNFNRVTEIWPGVDGRMFIADWWDEVVSTLYLGPDLLQLTGSAPVGVALGQTFSYNFNLANLGGAGNATGVTLSDPLPAGFSYVSATAGTGTCSQSGGTVTCAIGQLNEGFATTATITVTAPSTGSGVVANTTTVSANQPDPLTVDNTVTVNTVLNAADMSVTGTGSPAQISPWANATHTFTVSSGGSVAPNVTLNATLTSNVAVQSATASQGSCTPTATTVSCSLGTVAPGANATVTITVEAPSTVPNVVDTATVASSLTDPNLGNNTATVQTAVIGAVGEIFSVAGNGSCCSGGNGGPATQAHLYGPAGVAKDSAGNIYIADYYACTIRKVDTSGIITIYAGDPQDTCGYSGDGGPATAATLNGPNWLSFDAAGNLLVADFGNNAIRSINPKTGIITTVAGTGTPGYAGDGGAAVSAELNGPQSVLGLPGGGFVIGDTNNNVVRKVDASGKITTLAGNGTGGYSGDGGAATTARLNSPQDTAYDSAGNLLIADCSNQVIRKVDATTGNISTFAGTAGSAGYSGDGGPATAAQFNCPNGLALANGNLYISDYGNNVVRMIDANGIITTVAGNGNCCGGGDGGPATQASFGRTQEIWLDPSANMYIADFFGREIREVANVGQDLLNLTGSAPPFVNSGAQFTYSFHVTNPGTLGPATGVTFTDPLPSGVTFVSDTTSQGGCTTSSNTVTCVVGPLAVGAWDAVTITVNAKSIAADVTNTATVSANETDPALGDNSASVLSHVGEVDLSLTQTGPHPILLPINQPATFSMTVGSRGAATGVTLKDPLPSSLKFDSATASQGSCSASGGTVTCALGAIADGASATVTMTLTPIAAPGKITNTATVSATQPDINTSNNSASAVVYVNPPACGEVITTNTKLSADVGPCFGDGVIIGADGITLNLNGHSIIGDALQLDDMAGIRVPIHNGVTIENGTVTGFDDGIFVNSGGGNTITNMNVHDNIGPSSNPNGQGGFPDFGDGILLQHSAANKVLNSTISHNGIYDGIGIFGLDANFNLIQGDTITKNTGGAAGVAMSAFLELGDPRRSQSLYENNVIGNTIDDNNAAGITGVGNVNSKYLNNDIERNGLDIGTFPLNGIGLQPERSSNPDLNNDVENNKVIGNGNDGIEALEGANGSLIKNNTVENNDANHHSYNFDLNDFSGDCATNTWTGNTYSSVGVNPSCLASTNTLAPASATASAPATSGAAAKFAPPTPPDDIRSLRGHGHQADKGTPAQGSSKPASTSAPTVSTSTAPPCGSVITASVTLTADITGCTGPGLIVGSDNITINLGGHKIVGGGVADPISPGVLVEGHEGVTVTNGSISNFDAGVAVYEGANNTVSNLSIHDNIGTTDPVGTIDFSFGSPQIFPIPEMSDGIGVYHSFGTQVLNNTLNHNGSHAGIGVYGDDTNATVIKGNTVTNTVGNAGAGGIGIDVSAAFEPNDDRPYLPIDDNNIMNNTVTGSQGPGIVSLGNSNALIRGNVVQKNGVGASGAQGAGIELTFNSAGGASGGTIDMVLGNTVSGSGGNGIEVYSGGNTIQGNTATGDNVNNNGSFDLFDSHPTCDHNTWKGNTVGSAGVSPSCA